MTETTTSAKLTAARDGRVLRVTLTNPERLNAIDYATMAALGDVFAEASGDPAVRAVVITGEGKAFCTGADLSATAGGVTAEEVMDCAARLVTAIAESPVPVIARVNGAAAGVGVGIALADAELDARVDEATAKLAHGPRRALELTKQALNATSLASLGAALAREKAGQVELLGSPDFIEGATAMLQKRQAVFAE
ncbi:enoyl-CoA hydratase-related protein [Mycolicibacter sinensis]|uniref:Enoyl-CoA hydratase n=1 Tax=Mycolicibacter sinensis (strain JDM601) TaxID=875328 RepID=A0A1A2NKN0_MYCSD|nr:enoyl-CoA hydratase-related protein [Mycolicibacter sinensis]OBH15632.1 hypothetical protein A5694_08755 [Mycolicibacter sinensis]OBI31168.1 hypothetical protein A5710_18920 [Mycolicibacter sinensis]